MDSSQRTTTRPNLLPTTSSSSPSTRPEPSTSSPHYGRSSPRRHRPCSVIGATPRLVSVVVLLLVNALLLRNLRTVNRTVLVSQATTESMETGVMLQHLMDGTQSMRQVVEEQLNDAQGSLRKQLHDVLLSAAHAIGDGNDTASIMAAAQRKESALPDDQQSTTRSTQKPLNILILYPDDMRHDSLGIAGTQAVQTPFLDSLARKGMRFTHNCVTTSICWISRANLFTGQYVSRHQAELLRTPIDPARWNHTWPAILKEHGYYTGHIGKWQYWDSDLVKYRYSWSKIYEGAHYYGNMHVTDLNEQDALYFLREQRPKDKPFALQIAFYAPKAIGTGDMQWMPKNSSSHLYANHTFRYPGNMKESLARLPAFHNDNYKAETRKRWKQRFGTPEKFDASMKAYYRMITEIDECSRNIVAEIERQGLWNDTMIIFTTDNGFFHSEHGLSGKWFPYQESIRVPLILWDPRMPEGARGTTNDEFTLNIDLAQTILGAAGLPPHVDMQGRDIADLYLQGRDAAPWRKEFYYEFPGQGSRDVVPAANAVVRKDYKLFHYPEHDRWQLFNLAEDPLEEFDLIDVPKYAGLVAELQQRYEEMKVSVL